MADRVLNAVAGTLGWIAGSYGRATVNASTVTSIGETAFPTTPCVWASWHEFNLTAIATHRLASPRPVLAFVPPGWKGAAVRGWLRASRVEPVFLPSDPRGALALRRMRAALADGSDVMIALDGPEGPRREPKPGALWLAGIAGVPIIPMAVAAFPSIRIPRWDRHLVPLPGAHVVAAFGPPIPIEGKARSTATVEIARRMLNDLAARADAALDLAHQHPVIPNQHGA